MEDTLKEIISDVSDARRTLDIASERAKTAGLTDVHRKVEDTWSQCDLLHRTLTTMAEERSEVRDEPPGARTRIRRHEHRPSTQDAGELYQAASTPRRQW